MRVDSSGRLGIGTSSPGAALEVSGETRIYPSSGAANLRFGSGGSEKAKLAVDTSSNMIFETAGSERARIDSSGNLLVGTTSGSGGGERLNVTGSVSSHLMRMVNSNGSPYGPDIFYSGASPNNTSNEFIQCRDTTVRMTVRSNGGIANFSANNGNISDRREKTNFASAGEYLSKICAIPVQTFNYIDQNMDEDPGLTLGVVAQDVQAVAPELVMESNWGTEEAPKMRLSIYQTDLQYALMKAIQELKAEVDSLKAQLEAAQ
jgi:hypothetical protein